MKHKIFFGKTMRDAMNRAREEFGPEAMLIKQTAVAGGIELEVGIDEEILLRRQLDGEPVPVNLVKSNLDQPVTAFEQIAKRQLEQAKKTVTPKPAERAMVQPSQPTLQSTETVPPASQNSLAQLRDELNQLRQAIHYQTSQQSVSKHISDNPYYGTLYQKLFKLGLDKKLIKRICSAVNLDQSFDLIWNDALNQLQASLLMQDQDILSTGGIIALVGPTGVGKTTTIAKLATAYTLKYGADSLALITTDSYRVAGREQLCTYAKLLGVSVDVVKDTAELNHALNHFNDKRLILIDTAGVSQRDNASVAKNSTLISGANAIIKTYLTVSATSQQKVLTDTIQAFSPANLSGLIVTKLDEASDFGAIISTSISHNLAISYVCDGQHVPDDLKRYSRNELTHCLLQLAGVDWDKEEFDAMDVIEETTHESGE